MSAASVSANGVCLFWLAAGAEPAPSGAHLAPGTLLTEEAWRAFIADAVREELARRDGE